MERILRIMGTSLLAALLFAVAFVQADDAKPAPVGVVATVDVLRIYKSYKPVAEKIEELRKEGKDLEEKMQTRQIEIEALQRRLQTVPRENPEFDRLNLTLAKAQTELRLFIERERQQIQRREMKIQVEAYKVIQAEVRSLAKERGLQLVLVMPQRSLDSDNPLEVTQALNSNIIFSEAPDLTDEIIKTLESKAITN